MDNPADQTVTSRSATAGAPPDARSDGFDYDVLVVGSGFGGSVTALRLTEKGYRVGVLEAGRRFTPADFPATSWRLRRYLWAPRLGLLGIQRIHRLGRLVVLAGAGVGGGSLVYANTLYEPPDPFYADPQWAHITDWKGELAPFYDQAKRMLGVVENPTMTPADEQMRAVAEEMGVGHTFRMTPVGVFFGQPDVEVPDPYFGGAGPSRRGCRECGECMTGCRHGAKNMLTENYLYLAERGGAVIHPLSTVHDIRPLPGPGGPDGGYAVTVRPTTGLRRRRRARTLTARHVVLAAGAHGTQQLLHRLAETSLPGLSRRLGELTRTNSESLLGAMAKSTTTYDFTRGVAITSSFFPDADTHIEPVRYGRGSNAMGLLKSALTDDEGPYPRWTKVFAVAAKHPSWIPLLFTARKFSERTIIALVMQTRNNSITVHRRWGLLGPRLTSRPGIGEPNPTWIPAGNEAVERLARRIDGVPGGTIGELANMPMTAHILGGCVIGDSPRTGVIDPYHRVYGHPGLHIVDGSAVPANLGVNPSLTITALAERAAALWPNADEADTRPPLGAAYTRVPPVPPHHPLVPPHAPAALRLPVVEVRHGGTADGR